MHRDVIESLKTSSLDFSNESKLDFQHKLLSNRDSYFTQTLISQNNDSILQKMHYSVNTAVTQEPHPQNHKNYSTGLFYPQSPCSLYAIHIFRQVTPLHS